jgi:phage gp46-like protein
MSDIALRWNAAAMAADVAIEGRDLAGEAGLETAVMLSLFTDRRAEPGDPLPAAATDRRGWWGDAVPVVPGDLLGSRLWLLAREKETPKALERAEEYARAALQWLLDDRVAERVEVEADIPKPGWLGLTVVIHRPKAEPTRYRFTHAWAAQGA